MILATTLGIAAVVLAEAIPWSPPAMPTEPGQKAPAPAPAPVAAATLAKPIKEYEDREAACPLNQPCKEPSLVLTLARCSPTVGPQRVAAGGEARLGIAAPASGVAWAVVPWQKEHQEFLDRYARVVTDDDRLQLADWCSANRIPLCAEFMCREVLRAHWADISNSANQRALAAWAGAAARHASPYTFDLPVRGEWYVEKDAQGLLRRKPGTLFAHNLVIVRGGRQFAGAGGQAAGYFAWGQPIHGVADGIVTAVEDGNADPPAGVAVGPTAGNFVVQDCGGGVHAYYGHIKMKSATVKAGECIQRGQTVAQVGNSGGNGLPHLHFILLDGDHFSIPGRYRFEEAGPRGAVLRSGDDLREDTFVRPASEPKTPPRARPGAQPAPAGK
jgi:hypothetical protein